MGFRVKPNQNDGGDYEAPPEGSQPAVLVGLIELGHQETSYQGQPTGWKDKVFLVWELAEKQADGKPFIMGRDYTKSLGKKATLKGIVEKWRGKALGEDEEFDLSKLVGQSCILSLVHKVATESGNIYAKIDGVTGLPKGSPKVAASVKPIMWEIDNPRSPVEPWLPRVYGKPLSEVIAASHEKKHGCAPNGDAPSDGGVDEVVVF